MLTGSATLVRSTLWNLAGRVLPLSAMFDCTAPGQKAEQITPRGSNSGRMHSIIAVTAALPAE